MLLKILSPIKTHPQTLTALSADARRKLFLPANSSRLRNTPLHLKIRSGEWQHPSTASFQRRAARMGCNPHAAALPNLSNRHSASPNRHGQRGADSESLSPSPKQIPLSPSPSLRQTPFPAPHVWTHPPGFSQHPPAVRGAPRPRFPRRGLRGYRHASLRTRGSSGWRRQQAASHPRGRPLRAPRCGECVLPTSRKVPAGLPNLRRGDPGSPKPGGDLLPPASPCSREARPQLAPAAHPRCTRRLCPAGGGGGGRKRGREGGSGPAPLLGRAAQPIRRRALLRGGGGPQQCLPPPNIHTHIRAPTRQEEAFRRRWAFPEGSRRKFRPSRANSAGC